MELLYKGGITLYESAYRNELNACLACIGDYNISVSELKRSVYSINFEKILAVNTAGKTTLGKTRKDQSSAERDRTKTR